MNYTKNIELLRNAFGTAFLDALTKTSKNYSVRGLLNPPT